MKLEVLVSTMFQNDYRLLDKMKIDSDAVVVNQCDREGYEVLKYNGHQIIWIDSKTRGLSRSRNLAIKNASTEICLLADDDQVFRSGYSDKIIQAFEKNDEDILRFKVIGIEGTFKNYPKEERKISCISSMKTSSVEIAFRLKAILKKKIWFNELIGTGTRFKMGEENAFLFECFHKGLSMKFLPIEIADLHIGDSSWFNGYNKAYFLSKGAAFTAMQTNYVQLLIFQFALRKYRLYKNDLSFFDAIRYMELGRKAYLEDKKKLSF